MSGVGSALAGLDMDMPGDTQIPIILGTSYWMYELSRSVLNGSVPVDRLNDMATRIVAAWFQMRQDKDYPPPNFSSNTHDRTGPLYPAAVFSPTGVVNQYVNVQADHYKVARQVAQDAITLLKNDDNLLPLSSSQKLSVFGTDAQVNPDGPNACGNRACNKGTLGMGWGSGVADYPYFDDPISAIKRRSPNTTYYATDSFPSVPAPSASDVAVVFISSDSGENSFTVEGNHGDRDASKLSAWHNGDKLVQQAAAKFANVVVVVHTVGPLVLEPWISLPAVKSVLFAHLPGQEAGESLANILFGDVSPSGHLPYSITKSASDYPDSISTLRGFAIGQTQDTFSEGLYIDYRYLNAHKITPRYAFGHGLSYTTFSLTNASIRSVTPLTAVPPPSPSRLPTPAYNTTIPPPSEAYFPPGFNQIWRYLYSWLSKYDADAAAAKATKSTYPYPVGYSTTPRPPPPSSGGQGGNPSLFDVAYEISLAVTNVGTQYAGKASVQAYVQFPEGTKWDTPVIQLRDFEKTAALEKAGGREEVRLRLTRKDVSVWDVERQDWVVPDLAGRYKVWVGEGSDRLGMVCYSDTLECAEGVEGPV
ncbi:beta-glucosidase [Coniochaeta sp. 2T2.1]|nr:beta-glucosidase [Coniochaeta sp. 2T2.1]